MDEVEDGLDPPQNPQGDEGLGEKASRAGARAGKMADATTSAFEDRSEQNSFSTGRSGVGIGMMLFALGLFCGVPLAFFGFDYFVEYSAGFFGFLLGLLGTSVAILIFILVFRRPIWQRLYRRGEIEVEKLATPLADVAKATAENRLDMATDAARDFAEMVLARYAWLTTRRWLVGSITGLLAAIAALAGSTLLFQQNKLLAEQSLLLQGQTLRLEEQNALIETEIALAEAERSALIGPEILAISGFINEEAAALVSAGEEGAFYSVADLSPGLRGRIVALSNIARPYRYLMPGEIDARDSMQVLQKAVAKRPDILTQNDFIKTEEPVKAGTILIDKALSPERGQILTILMNARLFDTELLSFMGADFSFAEFRMKTMAAMSFRHGFLSFAKFSKMHLAHINFGAATLDHADFTFASIRDTDFGGIAADEIELPYVSSPALPYLTSGMTGVRFEGAVLIRSKIDHVTALVADFSNTALLSVDFTNSMLSGTMFNNAILMDTNFTGASLQSLDLQNALVTDAGFLDKVANQALAGTFVRERWQLVSVENAVLLNHPRAIEFSNYLPEGSLQGMQVYRITNTEQSAAIEE